jgi:predicted dehydrogenase
MTVIGIGVVGYGYWGPNVARNVNECQSAQLVACCDLSIERLKAAKVRYPAVHVATTFDELLSNKRIDALAICTPVDTHDPLAKRAMEDGRHVFVEKPLASSAREAEELVQIAAARNLILMTGHIFAYTGPVRKLKELVTTGHLGEIYYYDAVRVNLGLFQHDVSVIWDLAVHDLSIMDFVLSVQPVAVSAVGASHVAGQPENTAYLTLFFPGNLLGHVHVNWLAPVKLRRTLIGGSLRMAVYDDLEPSEKVKIYDKGVVVKDDPKGIYEMLVGYRTGDMWAPKLDMSEGLRVELEHFVDCVEHGTAPVTDGQAGLRVVRILEEATASIRQRGKVMDLTNLGGA